MIPFKDGSFDLITSNNGINNVADLPASLAEIARVSKPHAQFLFTMNTDRTFVEFYRLFRETLYDLGIPECNKALNAHIYQKRRPISSVEMLVVEQGFEVKAIKEESFSYRFSNGTAMLNHFFIRTAFLKSWEEIVPPEKRSEFFGALEKKLNLESIRAGMLRLNVPFVMLECERLGANRR